MLGYRATIRPLDRTHYRFELELLAEESGTQGTRRVAHEVVDLGDDGDLEMAFVGCVVTHIVPSSRARWGR